MQTMLKKYIYLALLSSMVILQATSGVVPLISPRSRSVDSALELAGWAHSVNLYDKEEIYGSLAITPQYTRSFRENKTIIPCLFNGDVDCSCPRPILRVSGKCSTNRTSTDWLADYFGLPSDFESEITFKPRIETFSVDFNLYIGLNEWWENAYFRIHAPIERAQYRLNMSETVKETGTRGHDEGYFSQAFIPRDNLLNTFQDFIVDCKVPTLDGQFNASTSTAKKGNVEFEKLTCAKISGCKKLNETKLSDLQCALGWNFFQNKNYHIGILIRASAPTGTRPSGEYLFEPIVGNGHHWELGGGISMHKILWESDDEKSSFGVWIDAHVTHLFKTHQKRFFDLVHNGGNSRYMLAAKLGIPVGQNLWANTLAGDQTGSIQPSAEFKNVFRPVANLTCCDVDVSSSVQGDVTAMFNYTCNKFSWDIGYNFWARGCEKIKFSCDCPCPLEKEPNTWTLKGDAYVYGFGANNATTEALRSLPVALSATNSKANVHSGSNTSIGSACNTESAGQSVDTRRNQQIDNAQFARLVTGNGANENIVFARNISAGNDHQTSTSKDPIFLTVDDIDLCNAETRGMSHKIFTHISYRFEERENGWIPYIGVGAKAEFAQNKECCSQEGTNSCDGADGGCCCCKDHCESCMKCNISEWGVWAKGGISFD